MITTEQIKELRDKTGVSVMQCRDALIESDGDLARACEVLARKSAEIADKKSDRALGSGTIGVYIHAGGLLASMVELACETDFVSGNAEFKNLAADLAMHVTAMDPENIDALYEQPYVKTPEVTVHDIVKAAVQKFGEHIEVKQFKRFSVK